MNSTLWRSASPEPRFPELAESSMRFDVAIVGGGITGVTAALLLKRAGKRVALLEAHTIGAGVTGASTAHLTQLVDTRYVELERRFGVDGARMVATSSRRSIQLIEKFVEELHIDCGLRRLPGFLYASNAEQADALEAELAAAVRAGVVASLVWSAPGFPLPITKALRVADQATFDPFAYVARLARELDGPGSRVFEDTHVVAIHDGEPCRIETREDGPDLLATHVIIATHSPLNRVQLLTKLTHAQSYVVSGPVKTPLEGLYWDMETPYHYCRTQQTAGGPQLIIGGEDHATGLETDTEQRFARLSRYAGQFDMTPTRHWSAQVVESIDGLPYIGRNGASSRVSTATGYGGNGITFGTVAAMLLCDRILERTNPWAELYESGRLKPLTTFAPFVAAGAGALAAFTKGALKAAELTSVDALARDHGAIVEVDGKRVAVFRDAGGALHSVSPICTHLGCHVSFNQSEKTWDCPCHGSRFTPDGEVLDGPAIAPLATQFLPPPRPEVVTASPRITLLPATMLDHP